ncbi:NYN domain-containing protein [Paenarthrobacter sp. Z7-10]|nr:NYN domain-containing protein [Paenarthrobacter sp. Z7-10]
MEESLAAPARRLGIRAAMFVDFDNVYTGLKTLDSPAAERFATDPGQWIKAIAYSDGSGDGNGRRFLVRNCYLNPEIYSKYRPFWTRAGFRVIDCPSLTQQGKSSTDINLVLDAMDVLAGSAHMDEFFIASADADFTSLVQRFRAADRRTTVIVAGAAAAAYREMADAVIQSYDFLAMLNGSNSPSVALGAGRSQLSLAAGAANHGSAAEAVRDFLRTAPGPVKGAIVAQRALSKEPSLANDWGGRGKFGTWVGQVDEHIQYSSTPAPGWVWDSTRFSVEELPMEQAAPAIEQQVSRVTDVPDLSAEQYRQLFVSLEVSARQTPNRNELSKLVRDECVAADVPVARNAINFVIQGLKYAKVPLNGESSAIRLATAWTKNVETMCRIAGMQFDDEETDALRDWASGGLLEKAPAEAAP